MDREASKAARSNNNNHSQREKYFNFLYTGKRRIDETEYSNSQRRKENTISRCVGLWKSGFQFTLQEKRTNQEETKKKKKKTTASENLYDLTMRKLTYNKNPHTHTHGYTQTHTHAHTGRREHIQTSTFKDSVIYICCGKI